MNGKDKCNLLREIRRRITEQYGLTYQPVECHHEGNCEAHAPNVTLSCKTCKSN